MMQNTVTIVIPTFHRPDRILRAVESCEKQTMKHQIIVVDDNGKETLQQKETEQKLSSLIEQGIVIYLINDQNSGASFSRNRGLEIAEGEFVTFLDDDDEIAPEKLRKQADLLNQLGPEYTCCCCDYHKLLAGGKVYCSGEDAQGAVYPYALARVIYNGSGSNLLARTDAARKIGGYDIRFAKRQDMEFMARLLKQGKLAWLKEDLLTIHYEIRENKLTYEGLRKADEFWIDVFRPEIDALPEKQKKAVYDSLALERWRYSIQRHEQKDAIANMKKYDVSFLIWLRYVWYLIQRILRKRSYGFKLVRL